MRRSRLIPFVMALTLGLVACGPEDAPSRTTTTAGAVSTTTSATLDDLSDLAFADPSVRYLQHALSDLGYHVDRVDGVYDQATIDALAEFQRDNGLDPTGHLDAATIVTLEDQGDEIEHLLVEVIQTQLAELGFYLDTVDGLWGSGTEAALTAFQTDAGLPATAVLDDMTFSKLVMAYDADVTAEHAAATGDDTTGTRSTIPEGQESDYLHEGDEGPQVQALQERLTELGYRPGEPDGYFGAHTASAVLAFQEREGLERDAIVGPEVRSRLGDPQGAGPRSSDPGPRVEIDLDRQVLFAIAADGTVTTINTSTGSGREFESAEPGKGIVVAHTPVGEFEILRVIDGLREAPLGTLYRPMYFTSEGGFAIHGNPHVPGYPASHGCARTANYDMDFLWDLGLGVGDPVWVYGENPPTPPNAAGGF